MKREFLVNLIFLFAINLVIKPLYIFGIDRSIQNEVGDVYGIYFALLSYTYLFQMINDMGLQNFTARHISMNPGQLNTYFSATLKLKLILAIIFAALVVGGSWALGYNTYYRSLLVWLVIIQVLTSGILYLRANIAGLGFYRFDSILSIMDKSILILVLGSILYAGNMKIEWFLYAQAGSMCLTFIVAFMFLKIKYPLKWISSNAKDVLKIAKESYPFAVIYILMIIYSRIDAVMLERMASEGIREAFIYASAYRLLDAANMFSYLFIGLLLPMFSRMVSIQEPVEPLFDVGIRLMTIAAVSVALPLVFYHQEIMQWLYTFGSQYSGQLLMILMIGYIFMAVAQIFGALLIAKGAIAPMNRIFLVGIVINIGLNLWLIPILQAKGAALSTVFTEIYVMLSMGFLVGKEFPGIWMKRTIVKLILFLPICAFGIFTLKSLLDLNDIVLFFTSVILCLTLALILRVIPVKTTLAVLMSNKNYHDKRQGHS
jgi:O-antigen/teichoic acid export membrane protein